MSSATRPFTLTREHVPVLPAQGHESDLTVYQRDRGPERLTGVFKRCGSAEVNACVPPCQRGRPHRWALNRPDVPAA
ncbi:hypothetical protein [Streptomyces hydrogenans]|uniref:hypothetical protein n=1 Tax=Streptomyces hydrogenans TaxID=1873719 RepID=UPI003D73AA18